MGGASGGVGRCKGRDLESIWGLWKGRGLGRTSGQEEGAGPRGRGLSGPVEGVGPRMCCRTGRVRVVAWVQSSYLSSVSAIVSDQLPARG